MQDTQQSVHLIATVVGYSSLTLLWLGMVLGIVLREGRAVDRIRPTTLASVHQTVNACGLTLAITHALTHLAVPDGPTRLLDVVIPFLHAGNPLGVGLGVVALESMIAIAGSVILRRRLGYRRWRILHRLGYLAFAILIGHVFLVGVDQRPAWVLGPVVTLGVVTVVLGLATAGWLSRLPSRVGDALLARKRGRLVTINVDATRCVHFGFCQHEAPELFEVREDGRLEHSPHATGEQVDAAIRAARACPTRAIMLSREAVRVVLGDPPVGPDGTGDPTGDDASDGSASHAATA